MTTDQNPAAPYFTRGELLDLGYRLQNAAYFQQCMRMCPDEISQRVLITQWMWVRYGAQSVNLPATYAAALMATDSEGMLDDEHLPWPCFEVQVPPGMVRSSHGEVNGVVITQVPREIILTGEIRKAKYFVTYHDEGASGTLTYESLADVAADIRTLGKGDYVTEGLEALFDPDREHRVQRMLTRLVAGVIIAINNLRQDNPKAFPQLPLKRKHSHVKKNTHMLGKPLKLDVRPEVHAYLDGTRRSAPQVSQMVRGFYRRQAHGPKHSLRKKIWVQPYYRGQGPLVPRPIHLVEPKGGEHATEESKA